MRTPIARDLRSLTRALRLDEARVVHAGLLYVAQGLTLSFSWSHAVTWIGNFYNSILLGGLGGDAARVFYICRDAPRQKTAGVASIAMDRLLGLGVLLMISLVALAAKLSSVAQKPELRTFALICSLALILGTAATAIALSINPQRWPLWMWKMLSSWHAWAKKSANGF